MTRVVECIEDNSCAMLQVCRMRNQFVEKACIFINNISFTVSSSDESLLMKFSH